MYILHMIVPASVYLHLVQATFLGAPTVPAGTGDLNIPDLKTFLQQVAHTLFGLGATLCVIGIVVGGMMRATAFGSERRIAASNVALSCAVIGFLIILLAQPIGDAITKAFP